MQISELLSGIYCLLLEGRRSSATDLLVEFILTNQKEFAGLSFSQLGELSHGPPEEIVSHLRKKLIDYGFLKGNQQLVNTYEDPHDLNHDDLEMIDAVATEFYSRSESYLYDEEDTFHTDKLPISLAGPVNSHSAPNNDASTHIEKSQLSEDDEEDYDEELDESITDELDPFAYDPTADENDKNLISYEDDEDEDDLKDSGCLSEEIEPLDDLLLQADNFQSLGNLVDDSLDDFFDFDEDDSHIDEDDRCRSNFVDIDTSGSLTTEERARQIAIQVAMSFNWGHSGVELLSEIFEEHGWGPARIAIERMLEKGISEDELLLVKEMKDLWDRNEEYALAFLKPYNRTGYCTYHGGRVLSWVMAAKIVSLFPNGDICEVECFLDKAFDAWYDGSAIKRRHPVFLNFLKHTITWFDPERWLPGGMFFDDATADDFEYEIEKDQPSSFLYHNLADYGLIVRL